MTECEKRLEIVKKCFTYIILLVCSAFLLTGTILFIIQWYYYIPSDAITDIMIMIVITCVIYTMIPTICWVIWYVNVYSKMYIPVKKSKYTEMKKKIKEIEK